MHEVDESNNIVGKGPLITWCRLLYASGSRLPEGAKLGPASDSPNSSVLDQRPQRGLYLQL
ncbi:hypothetical protein J6590_015764 [Homalodisca vitripennis]|nr:hypothetical protein J6590_015764 [Homalodisca vitripennis]